MGVRTFTRRFRDEVGTSPLRWLLRCRPDQARRLLESTDPTVTRVTTASGFGDAVALRKHFSSRLGLSRRPTAVPTTPRT